MPHCQQEYQPWTLSFQSLNPAPQTRDKHKRATETEKRRAEVFPVRLQAQTKAKTNCVTSLISGETLELKMGLVCLFSNCNNVSLLLLYFCSIVSPMFWKKKSIDNAIWVMQTSLTTDKHICVPYPYTSTILFPRHIVLAVISEPSAPPPPQIAFLKKSGCRPFHIVGQL